MATIEKSGKRWRVRQFTDGKLKTVASCATRTEAETVLRRAEDEERARSRVVYSSQLPMTEVLERWSIAKIGAGNDPLHTRRAVERLRTLIAARNWKTTAAITPLSVSDYRTAGGSPRGCATLSGVLRWSSDYLSQHVDPKTLISLRPGRAGKKPSPILLSAHEIAAAETTAARMSDSAGLLIHCLSTYGWRPITAARLNVSDFNAVTGIITCRVKGGDIVSHPLLPQTVAGMRRRAANADPADPLFLDPRLEPGASGRWQLVGGNTISQWSRWHLKLRVYDLKRYAISEMLNRGISPQDIASFTGHRTVAQILRYSRSNEQRQRKTLEILGKNLESGPDQAGSHGGTIP